MGRKVRRRKELETRIRKRRRYNKLSSEEFYRSGEHMVKEENKRTPNTNEEEKEKSGEHVMRV